MRIVPFALSILLCPVAVFAQSPAPKETPTNKQEATQQASGSPEKSSRDILEKAWKDAMKEEVRVMARFNMGQASQKELDQAAAKTAAAKKALDDWKPSKP